MAAAIGGWSRGYENLTSAVEIVQIRDRPKDHPIVWDSTSYQNIWTTFLNIVCIRYAYESSWLYELGDAENIRQLLCWIAARIPVCIRIYIHINQLDSISLL